jgi:hypothetical protein
VRLRLRFTLIVFVLVVLALFGMSVRRLRMSREDRWPFVTSATLTAFLYLLPTGGVLVALTVGRATWNDWTAGTPHQESVTLGLLLVGFPLMLALALVFFLVGTLRRRRHRA